MSALIKYAQPSRALYFQARLDYSIVSSLLLLGGSHMFIYRYTVWYNCRRCKPNKCPHFYYSFMQKRLIVDQRDSLDWNDRPFQLRCNRSLIWDLLEQWTAKGVWATRPHWSCVTVKEGESPTLILCYCKGGDSPTLILCYCKGGRVALPPLPTNRRWTQKSPAKI